VRGTDAEIVALVLRGDHELNEVKAAKLPQVASPLSFVSESEVRRIFNCQPNYLGPVNLTIPMIVDWSAAQMADFVCGANEDDWHWQGVNWERDLALPETADIRIVTAGEPSPDGKGKLDIVRGIEAGHIFQLGQHYSRLMKAQVLNGNGQEVPLEMGCYGIGVSRLVAACIEQNHDQRGIIWPETMAPFQIALIPINQEKSQRLKAACQQLYQQLKQAGFDVLYDDRPKRPGVMFADMDLIGIPHRLVLNESNLDQQMIEYKHRRHKETQLIALEQLTEFLQENINA
jgi:prolyl-tRNA synthetase